MGKHFKKVAYKPWHRVALAATAIIAPGAGTLIESGTAEAATTLPAVFKDIIRCESGGNPTVANRVGTASGLYQFLDSSWMNYGGGKYSSRAKFATVAQQTEIALNAFNRSGTSPWDPSRSCWSSQRSVQAPSSIPKKSFAVKFIAPPPRHLLRTYVVKRGDTLSKIAHQQGIAGGFRTLFKINHGTIKNPNLIFIGQRINLA